MVEKVRAHLVGSGRALPRRVVTNEELATLMDTSHAWIERRTGIQTRHYVSEDEDLSDLALTASEQAIDAAGWCAEEIDLIILATLSPEYQFPGSGMLLQHKLGLSKTPALDIRNQCTGFLYGLGTAKAFIESGMAKKVLVVGAEVHSRGLDFTDRGRSTTVIFGDGAGALCLEAKEGERGIQDVVLRAQGEFADRLCMKSPGSHTHPMYITHEILDAGEHFPYMDGRFVFKHACTRMPEAVMEVMTESAWTGADVDWFFFHQANIRINEYVAKTMGIDFQQCPFNADRYGNCSAASIPMLMDECIRDGRFKEGQNAVVCGFGAGFGWGALTLRY